jgi:hypothetical protein
MKKIMTREHEKFPDFIDDLIKKCNFEGEGKETTWKCDGDHRRTTILLKKYDVDIDKSIKYFEENGGFCDCEILFNVDKRDCEEE